MKLEDSSASYTNSAAHVIENLRADFNTFTGIEVNGTGNILRGNQVVNTGGSTVSTNSYAITARGPGALVLNNDVIGTVAANAAYGVEIVSAASSVVEKNRIANTTSLSSGNVYGIHAFNLDDASAISANTISNESVAANSYGIYVDTDADVTVSDNRLSRLGNGIFFTGASGGYMNNLVRAATTP